MASITKEIRHSIEVRKMDFTFSDIKEMDWFDGNPILSAFIAVLSATFPPGERMFIDAVRAHQNCTQDPYLLNDIKLFIRQEAHHTHQHQLVNSKLSSLGWAVEAVEIRIRNAIEKHHSRFKPITILAGTACLEHITAIVADWMLNNPDRIKNMPNSCQNLLLWHSLEELEHKSVAFDVYMAASGDRKALRKAMRLIGLGFPILCVVRTIYLLIKARRMPKWQHIKEAGYIFFNKKNGFARCIYRDYKDFFRTDFHPNDHDHTGLIEQWKETIGSHRLNETE